MESTTPAAPDYDPAPMALVDEPPPYQPSQPVLPSNYPISFTGKGSEYFRIWIVNTLLIIITFGIYLPWAKVRKRQYIARNMHFDGASFDFHGSPIAMLKGWIVAAILLSIYSYITQIHPSLFALSIFIPCMIVALPWLLWKSLRFNLSNSSYRALRFQFTGSLKQAYSVFVPIIMLFLMPGLIGALDGMLPEGKNPYRAYFMILPLLLLVVIFFYPVLHYRLKHYQHSHYRWASLQTSFQSSGGKFYKTWLKYSLVSFLISFGLILVIGVIVYLLSIGFKPTALSIGFTMAFIGVMFYPVLLGISFALFHGYFQDLIWNATRADGIQFQSQLIGSGVVWAYVKNALFTVLTLGIYWPFAYIALLKVRVQACSLTLDQPLMHLAQAQLGQGREGGAVGDASMDAFGIDIAL